MNLKKSFHPGLSRFFLTFICGSLLTAIPAKAQISVVNTGSLNNINDLTSYSLSFNAGASAKKLIVSAGTESAVGAVITGITYNGVALTLIPNTGNAASGRNRGIWYLDNPHTGGAANIVVSGQFTAPATVFNHMRLGVVSISGSAPGVAIGNIASAASVSLNVPFNNSFVFAAHASNLTPGATLTTANTPLTQIFSASDDSANMAAGRVNSVAAGPATYSFTNTGDSPQTSAAAFVPASAAPVIVSTTPANSATAAPLGGNLVASFSEPVVKGTGNIELWQVGGSLVESFDVASSPQLTFSGQTLTINPTSDLVAGVQYYVLIPATAVVDTSGGNAFAGISDSTTWRFGETAPVIATLSPADGSASVTLDANLVATFSEPVVAGTGNIELWQAGGGSPLETFDVTSPSAVTFSGASLTIHPTVTLGLSTQYHVNIPATAVKDLSGNFFSGLTLNTDWNFSATASGIWTGTTSGAWLTATNWFASAIPGSASTTTNTDGALFDVATQPTVGIDMNTTTGNYYLGAIDFDDTTARNIGNSSSTTAGVLTLNGAMLDTVANTILYNRNTALLTVQAIQTGTMGLALGNANNNIVRISGTGGITISSIVTGTDKKLTRLGTGSGILTLTGATNSYSGGTDILAGTVQLSASAAAGSGTIQLGATTGSNTAELRLAVSGTDVANALTVNAGSAGTKTLANQSTNTVTYSGDITVNDNLSILSAPPSGTGGRLTVSGDANTIATGKTVAFSNTGTITNATTDSALWGGLGSISYTSSSVTGFAISGAKTYSGGATLGAMSGTGVVGVQTSSTGPANAPDNGAFGKGTLSIGATQMRAGTAGDITIGNPVTFTGNPTFTAVANEKSLIFSGNASLGATRTLTVETGSTVTTKAVEFSGEISGSSFGITKAGAGTLRLSGTNTYTGDTTVNAGVLAVSGTSITNTGTLVINGGTVDLTNTETVATLFLGVVEQPLGNYSTTSVPVGATITTASFSGTGILTVGAPTGSAYSLWAATNAPTTGTNPNADEDGDGVSNAVEFVLGGTISSNDLSKLPTPAVSGGNITFTFNRAVASIDPKTTVTIEVSTDLVTWNTPPSPYAVPDAATGPVNPGVTVVEDTFPSFDTVTLTVPKDAASKFARLKVIQLP